MQIDTSNILFICGGAFAGIDEIRFKRMLQIELSGKNYESLDAEQQQKVNICLHENVAC